MRARIIVGGLFILAGVAVITVVAADDVVVEKNVVYGKAGDVELTLDLAHPKTGTGPFPGIVFIHGGGWAGGERSSYHSLIERAAKQGYVAATISYRLTGFDPKTNTGKVPFPAQLHDCKCAVRWMRSVADKYHVDPQRIGVTGASAGGHLSLLVGLVDREAELEGDGGHAEFSSQVSAVVNYCGPTDLVREYDDVKGVQPFLQALCGGTPETAADAFRVGSPVSHVHKAGPPILTLHGDKDDLVPVSQARLLEEAIQKKGGRHELVILPGQGHAFAGAAAKQAEAALWAFFEKHLKAK